MNTLPGWFMLEYELIWGIVIFWLLLLGGYLWSIYGGRRWKVKTLLAAPSLWGEDYQSHLEFQQFWEILEVAEYLGDLENCRMIIGWWSKRTGSRVGWVLEGEKITTEIQVIFAVYCNNLVLSLSFSHSIVKRKMLHKLKLILRR